MKRIILVLILMLLASGCTYAKMARKNNDLMLTLNAGQTKQEVLDIMGSPTKSEKYSSNKKEMDVWYYRTDSFATGGWDTDDYFTPVIFENGKLVGWGNDLYFQKITARSMVQDYQ